MDITDPIISIFSILFLVAVLHGLFIGILILNASFDKSLRFLLASVIIVFSLWILNYLFYTTGWIKSCPHLLDLYIPILYLAGPILLFISRRLAHGRIGLMKGDLVHLLPFAIILGLTIPEYLLSAPDKLQIIENIYIHKNPSIGSLLWANKLNILTLGYAYYGYRLLISHTTVHPFYTSYLRILKITIGVITLKTVLPFFLLIININGAYVELLLVFLLATVVHSSGYFYFNALGVPVAQQLINKNGINGKYHTSPLEEDKISFYVKKIEVHFINNKPWIDPAYSIDNLSRELNIPKHHLSQVINEGLGIKFYDLINKHRVEEVVKRLIDGEHHNYSIGGIGADCGFNSASTFHRAFKKYKGMTPTAYLKSISKSL